MQFLLKKIQNRELQDTTLLTRQRALRSLCDYLHDPEHIAVCIDHDVPKSLQTLLTDADPFCRYKSAECLFVLACNFNGRKSIVDNNIIPTLAILFDDQVVQARINAHKTVEMVSELPYGMNLDSIRFDYFFYVFLFDLYIL